MAGPPTSSPLIREEALLNALLELVSSLDLYAAMQKVADLGHHFIGARTCTVRLLDEQTMAFVLRGARGATEDEHARKWLALESSRSIVGEIFRTGCPYVCLDIQADPHYEMKDFAAKNNLVALLAQPVQVGDRLAGVITLYFPSPGDVTEERQELARMLARFAARVIDMKAGMEPPGSGSEDAGLPAEVVSAHRVNDAAMAIAQRAIELCRWQAASVAMPRGLLGGLDNVGTAGDLTLLDHPRVKSLAQRAFSMAAVQDEPIEAQSGFLLSPRHAAAFPCSVAEQQVAVLTVVNVAAQPLSESGSASLFRLAVRSAETLLRLRQGEQLEAMEELLATLGVSREDRLEPGRLQGTLLDLARKQLGAEGAVLYLWDAPSRKYVPRVAKGFKNVLRPVAYAREGYGLGEAFVGKVAARRKLELREDPARETVDEDPCLTLLRQQTHTRELTLCLGVPLEPQVKEGDAPPLGVIVFADGRPGAGLRSQLRTWRGWPLSFLAAQVGAFVRGQEILQREDRLFFLATHQAKNPLAKIVQFTGAIEKYGPKPEYLKDLSRCAKEASHNVEQVLHVERALSRRAVQPKDADLSELVADAVAGHRLAAEAHQCTLSTDVEPGCRIGTVEVYVRGILDNLIDNAVKYTSEGTGRVEVRLRRSDTGYVLEVADNGPGLPTGVRETVEAGTDVRPRAGYDLRGGFGLGLFIVTSYVGLLGWRMTVGSCLPSGTTFMLFIPATALDESPGP